MITGLASCGGKLYATIQHSAGEPAYFDSGTMVFDPEGANAVYAIDMDAGSFTQVCGRDGGGIRDFVPMADGTVWAWVYIPVTPESRDSDPQVSSTLFHLDGSNTVLAAVDVETLTAGSEDNYALCLEPLDDSTLLVTWGGKSGCAVNALDSGGNISDVAATDSGCLADMARAEDGSIVGLYWDYDQAAQLGVYSLVRLDPATGAVTELPLPGDAQLHPGDQNAIQCVTGGKIYLEDYQGTVSVYDTADGTFTRLFNWLDMGVTGGGYGAPVEMFLRDGALWAAALEDDRNGLTAFPLDTDGGGRETLSLACFSADDNILEQAVAEFNRANTQYRIAVKYYSIYDDPLAQFNYDVIAGQVPDILSLYQMPYDTLRHQGMLADLTSYIDADPDIRREDYLDWSWRADTASDGKIYSLVTRFFFGGYWSREGDELTRESFTLDKYLELAESGEALEYANGSGAEYRAWAVEGLISAELERFADIDTAQCHFDSPEFMRILQAVQNMTIATGDAYLTTRLNTDSLWAYHEFGYLAGDGYTVPLGDPTSEGGKFLLRPQQELAMSAGSAHPDACWQFIRTFLLPQLQQADIVASLRGFPVSKSALAALAAQEMSDEAQMAMGECTQADVDAVNALFETGDIFVDRMESMADAVCDIVHEELVPFFSGAVTAETAAAGLQSRVGLYLSEHS